MNHIFPQRCWHLIIKVFAMIQEVLFQTVCALHTSLYLKNVGWKHLTTAMHIAMGANMQIKRHFRDVWWSDLLSCLVHTCPGLLIFLHKRKPVLLLTKLKQHIVKPRSNGAKQLQETNMNIHWHPVKIALRQSKNVSYWPMKCPQNCGQQLWLWPIISEFLSISSTIYLQCIV